MNSKRASYNPDFFAGQRDGSRRSAEAVVPVLLEIVRPQSVLDVGCGVGTWLSVFRERGLTDLLGLDGPYVDRSMLRIGPDDFREVDLAEPFWMGRRFDLVMSLEVAEHLPSEAAATFVSSLTRHGSVVLFSAAVPLQGGTHHVNEQWQPYWVELFAREGYACLDVVRSRIWTDESVEYWYAQNSLLFIEKSVLAEPGLSARVCSLPSMGGLALVHPGLHLDRAAGPKTETIALSSNLRAVRTTGRELLRLVSALPASAWRAARRRR